MSRPEQREGTGCRRREDGRGRIEGSQELRLLSSSTDVFHLVREPIQSLHLDRHSVLPHTFLSFDVDVSYSFSACIHPSIFMFSLDEIK